QLHLECRTVIRLAACGNITSTLLDYYIDSGKTKAGAFRFVLSCEERFEDMRQCLGIHSATGVFDSKHNVAAAFQIGTFPMEIYIVRIDSKYAALGHRIKCINDEIHKDLFYLAAVRFHAPEILFEFDGHLNILGDERADHVVHTRDHGVDIQNL